MPEGDKPKLILETDLIKFKASAENREKNFKKDLADIKAKFAEIETTNKQYEAQIKTLKANLTDDDEVKEVRDYLLSEDKRLAEDRSKLGKERADNEGLLKKAMAKGLVIDYKGKGLELKEEDLLSQEDMDKHVSSLWTEHLSKENERLKTQPSSPAESTFEHGSGGVVKKSVADMTPVEFESHWKQQNMEALAKK